MADIFISYAREDLETAKTLAQALAEQGWSVWWDTRLQAGEVWSEVIEQELKAARCVVVLWSKTSVQSRWVRVEATVGLERRILFPALIEDVQLPLAFSQIQTVHLIDWYGEQSHTGFKRLVDAVASQIGLPEQTRATSSFFRARGGKRPLNEAKLILVGFGGVGKTSLVNRIVRGKSFDHYERMTEGIAITDWSLRLHSEDVRLHVWDFGGQEIMHATHQFFLTARSLYLLVLNGRQGREDADAEYWLNMIKSLAADSPVIVILNKIQEHPFDINRRALQGKFPNIKAFVETDCSDDTGLADLHRLIREETDRLPHLRDTFPAAWFAIKDQLAEMAESYLTFDAYQQLCAQHGECDEEGQERLASFLHILGVALNYRDDPRLHDTHVLKPEWVTQGIYTILNAKRLAAEYGELTLSELKEILNATRYPRAQHLFLIELMRKFELCFRFPDADDRFLVPELLDKQEPELTSRFVAKDILAFEYHYPGLLPEGLLPRFIVRTSALSTNQARWRTGVVLSFEGNRALVKGDPTDRKVRIAVDGPAQGRRRLLAVIRSDFEQIHRSYAFQPKEMVPVQGRTGIRIPYAKLLVLERNGISEIQEVFGEEVLTLSVRELLDGVDLEGTRLTRAGSERTSAALSAFVSYSHKDEALRAELETHLKLLKRQGLLDLWSDRCITAGSEWEKQIDENLERADIILLLVSADFIASGYCWDIEVKRAMERHATGEAQIIPVIVRECNWKSAPFGKLQALPEGGKAVCTWGTGPYAHDMPWTKVEEGIRAVLDRSVGKDMGKRAVLGLAEQVGRRQWWSELREWFLS